MIILVAALQAVVATTVLLWFHSAIMAFCGRNAIPLLIGILTMLTAIELVIIHSLGKGKSSLIKGTVVGSIIAFFITAILLACFN